MWGSRLGQNGKNINPTSSWLFTQTLSIVTAANDIVSVASLQKASSQKYKIIVFSVFTGAPVVVLIQHGFSNHLSLGIQAVF